MKLKQTIFCATAMWALIAYGDNMSNDPFDIGNEPLKFDSSAESTASSYNLNKQEICELEHKANSGDSNAAFRLYQYYFFVALEHKESEKWLHRSAELGNETAKNIIIKK